MIHPVSHQLVTQTWQEIAAIDPENAPALITQIQAEQPALLAYLLAISDACFDDSEERELFVYLGIVVWQMMKRGHKRLRRVSIKKLDKAKAQNIAQLEMMEKDTEADFMSATLTLIDSYPEPEVLRYIVEALMETNPDDVSLSDEVIGGAFLYLKTGLDALISCR